MPRYVPVHVPVHAPVTYLSPVPTETYTETILRRSHEMNKRARATLRKSQNLTAQVEQEVADAAAKARLEEERAAREKAVQAALMRPFTARYALSQSL